jgi:hypothetical protein
MTQTEPDAKPLPDSEVRPLRESPDERQDRSRRDFEADPVIEFVIRTVVWNVAGTVRRNVKDNVQNVVSGIVTDNVNRNVPEFRDKALVRTIDPRVSLGVAQFEDEFEPEFDDRFAADFIVRFGTVTLTFIRAEVSCGRETTAAALHRDFGLLVPRQNR